ncbi:uncharacterized protein [Ptychodera flava]|uniref:uncharacterized protein isoform X1 n=1 Tax=Ptychodera flava TaxID=63121 RepID=UPI00396A03A6
MNEELKTLRAIGSSEDKLCDAIQSINQYIKHSDQSCIDMIIENGVVETCLGFLRSTRFTYYFRAHVCAVLNLLCHGNSKVKQQVCCPGNLSAMLDDITSLCFTTKEDQIVMVEQATSLIQTLTYDHPENQNTLKKQGLVEMLVNLCDVYGVKHTPSLQCRYPDEALDLFRQLTDNKVLIGNMRQLDDKKLSYLQRNMQSVYRGLESEEIYEVDLYDTSTETDISISKELISAGYAWPSPDQVSQPGLEENYMKESGAGVWRDVVISEYTDIQCFCVRLVEENTSKTIHKLEDILKYKNPLQRLLKKPCIGETIIAETVFNGQHKLYRAKVKDWITMATILVKALDYGHMEKLPWKQQYAMPEGLQSISPQAVLCTLRGIHPPPVSHVIIKNSLGILENLCQSSPSNAQLLMSNFNMDVVIKLCQSPVEDICVCVAGILLNCARNASLRAFIGQRGGVAAMLDICKRFQSNEDVLLTAIGALQNQLYECVANCLKMVDLNGVADILHITQETHNEDIKMKALCAIKNLCSSVIRLEDVFEYPLQCKMVSSKVSSNIHNDSQIDEGSVASAGEVINTPKLIDQAMTSTERQFGLPTGRVQKAMCASVLENVISVYKEKVDACMAQALSSSTLATNVHISDEYINEGCLGQISQTTNEDDSVSAESDLINATQMVLSDESLPFYVKEMPTNVQNDSTHDVSPFTNVMRFSDVRIAKTVCAFLNSGRGGTIYFGIQLDNQVQGIKVTRNERDQVRLSIDRIMGRMIPAVTYNKYSIVFAPVITVDSRNCNSGRQQIEDMFVIELHINPTSGIIYTTPDPSCRCYFRKGIQNTEVSHQEIHEMILIEEEAQFKAEIESLGNEIMKIKQPNGR